MCFSFRSSCGQRGVLGKSIRETRRCRSKGAGAGHRRGVSQIRGGHEGTECPHEDPGTCKTLQAEFVSTYAEYSVLSFLMIPRDARNIPPLVAFNHVFYVTANKFCGCN